MKRGITEYSQGSETTLRDTIMMVTLHYTFVQTQRLYNIKGLFNINYGLWVIMMCQYSFTDYKKCTTLVENADSGKGYASGQGLYGKSLYLPLNFAVTLKLL